MGRHIEGILREELSERNIGKEKREKERRREMERERLKYIFF